MEWKAGGLEITHRFFRAFIGSWMQRLRRRVAVSEEWMESEEIDDGVDE